MKNEVYVVWADKGPAGVYGTRTKAEAAREVLDDDVPFLGGGVYITALSFNAMVRSKYDNE